MLRPVAGIKLEIGKFLHNFVTFLHLKINVIYVLLRIKKWLMWLEILLVFILLKYYFFFNISRIRVVSENTAK